MTSNNKNNNKNNKKNNSKNGNNNKSSSSSNVSSSNVGSLLAECDEQLQQEHQRRQQLEEGAEEDALAPVREEAERQTRQLLSDLSSALEKRRDELHRRADLQGWMCTLRTGRRITLNNQVTACHRKLLCAKTDSQRQLLRIEMQRLLAKQNKWESEMAQLTRVAGCERVSADSVSQEFSRATDEFVAELMAEMRSIGAKIVD